MQAYKTLHGDYEIFDPTQCAINEKKGKPCETPTPKQIQKWRTSADGKKVAIDVPATMIKFLRDFRQERVIERYVMEIGDSQMRDKLEKDLKAVTTQTDKARSYGFTNLSGTLESDSPGDRKAAYVIKLIADLPENKDNPFTQMLLAKMELQKIYSGKTTTFGAGTIEAIEKRISRAADLAAGYDEASRTRDPKKAVSRLEAQRLNEEAAHLAEQFGKPSDARFYTLLARFYEVDDEERKPYELMTYLLKPLPLSGIQESDPLMPLLPRIKHTVSPVLTAPTKEQVALDTFNYENPPPPEVRRELAEDPQKHEWKFIERTDGKGGVKTKVYEQFQKEGSLKPTGVQDNKNFIYLDKKGKEIEKDNGYERKMTYTSRQTFEAEEINSRGIMRATTTAGAVGAIDEVNKWTPFLADLYYGTTAKKIAESKRLTDAEFVSLNFPVPPTPERIQRMKRNLIRHRYETQSEFLQVQRTMKRLEALSNAFWNR